MASVYIIIFASLMASILFFQKNNRVFREFLVYIAATLPLVLIITGVLESDGISTVCAGLCLFGFPIFTRNNN